MTRMLRDLLNAKEPLFSATLRQLEAMTGRRGIDIAYGADIVARGRAWMAQIGLDPADTTAHELYRALQVNGDDGSALKKLKDVALICGDEIVSFNVSDIEANASLPFKDRKYDGVKREIVAQLSKRYEKNASVDSSLIRDAIRDLEKFGIITIPTLSKENNTPRRKQ